MHEHIRTVFAIFSLEEHGLSWSVHARDQDRMNKEGPARSCSLKPQACLRKLIAGPAADARLERPWPQMKGSL
eukprot:5320835-Prymnesium_polylepis.1